MRSAKRKRQKGADYEEAPQRAAHPGSLVWMIVGRSSSVFQEIVEL